MNKPTNPHFTICKYNQPLSFEEPTKYKTVWVWCFQGKKRIDSSGILYDTKKECAEAVEYLKASTSDSIFEVFGGGRAWRWRLKDKDKIVAESSRHRLQKRSLKTADLLVSIDSNTEVIQGGIYEEKL